MNTKSFIQALLKEHQNCDNCPSPEEVATFFKKVMGLLFMDYAEKKFETESSIEAELSMLKIELQQLLNRNPINSLPGSSETSTQFLDKLPELFQLLNTDIDAIVAGDPACTGRREVIRSYPGFYAIAAYRIANAMHRLNIEDLPRIITEFAHSKTGVDIHPGAQIGKSFCIDHGTGIVIGETTIIEDHVKIYQGVTLGALSVNKEEADLKRHPTIEDHCVLYSGATILGGDTIIGHHSIIGGNTWVTKSVPAYSKIYYQAKMNVNGGEEDTMVFKEFAK